MEFWGVEVKRGESLKVDPGDDKLVHLSTACLGDVRKDKGSEPVSLYVKIGDQKLVLGTLSSEKFPQISYDLIFEKEFELSHNWKFGSVFFTGFKVESELVSDDDEDSDNFDGEDIPINAANGKPENGLKSGAKPDVIEANEKKTSDPKQNENGASGKDEESSEFDTDEDSSEDEPMANGLIESSEDDDDSDEDDEEDDDEETPKKIEGSNKRVFDSSKKTPVPVKRAKFVTPEKTGVKNGGHVDTPHPSKHASKAAANNNKQPVKQQTPKSNGDYSCKPCNRSFKTEDALGSHNKAKHSAK
ncbi:histone deacetylase HDT1 [Cicer arietinum]|uniref:Histone deacetylase HDT1 n=1 Tax=Cicer arietinum TaxID=3827 RepID=A0A1S2XT87_CICAR|nr:histone deacetylase HDT1 [Cicer arietinum]